MNVTITREAKRGLRWPDLCAAWAETLWASGAVVCQYVETTGACSLTTTSWPAPTPPADAWEGRLFGGCAELRWAKREDGLFDAWALREVSADRGEAVVSRDRPYVLVGRLERVESDEVAVFSEARYPGVKFRYPVRLPEAIAPGDRTRVRAAIVVREYLAPEPVWASLRDVSEVNDRLDAPRLVAHRFLRVEAATTFGVGQGGQG